MQFNPKVSIIIPVYNGSNYLRDAIDSALAQSYTNCEVIVVNDGSCDNGKTEAVAMSYDGKIRYFSKENGGVASALNLGIREMTGEYFSWLSHDDLYYPDKVDSQIQALSVMSRQKTILYGDFAVFLKNSDMVARISLPVVPHEKFRFFITVNNSLHGCTLLIPKAAFAECGFFNEKLRTTQDFDLWFRMAEKYNFVHIPHLLVKSRQHSGQGSITMRSTALLECNQLLSGFVDGLSAHELKLATNKSLSLSYAEIAANMLQRGFFDTAQHATNLAIKNINGRITLNAFRTYCALLSGKVHNYLGLLHPFKLLSLLIGPLKNLWLSFRIRR